jgi:hypothetical protein
LEPTKAVSVPIQILISVLVPFAAFWATYRVKKLRLYVLFILALFGISFPISWLIPFPFSLFVIVAIGIGVTIYYIRKWSIEWNNKISSLLRSCNHKYIKYLLKTARMHMEILNLKQYRKQVEWFRNTILDLL